MPHHKTRGTIIVDSNALFFLSAPTGKGEDASGNTCRYLSLLNFLAAHGFKIIIPESVAFETTRYLASGKNINEWRDNQNPSPMQQNLMGYIRHAINGGDNLHVPVCDGPKDVKKFLDEARHVTERTKKGSAQACRLLGELMNKKPDQLADDEIVYMAQRFKESGQLFILSMDHNLRIRCATEAPNAGFINGKSFLKTIAKNKLHVYVSDLCHPTNGDTMAAQASAHIKRIMGPQNRHGGGLDISGRNYNLTDVDGRADQTKMRPPFHLVCAALANELAKKKAVPDSWQSQVKGHGTTPYAGRR